MFNIFKRKQTFRIALYFWLMTALSAVNYAAAQNTVPDAPTNVTATFVIGSGGSLTVAFLSGAGNGGSVVIDYTATCASLTSGSQGSQTGVSTTLVVSGLLAGTNFKCSVIARNVFGTSQSSALSNQAFVQATAPDAPTSVIATAGDKRATVTFTAPASNGSPITGYTVVSSSGGTDTVPDGPALSHVITGLTNGTPYTFTATALNAAGVGPTSAVSSSITPFGLTAVSSRKTHGLAGTYDLPLATGVPINGAVTVEPRAIGSGHQLVYQFDTAVGTPWTATVTPVGTATPPALSGNTVSTTLTGIPDKQLVTVNLNNANGAAPPLSMGFLIGDVDSSRAVTASDISSVKAETGKTAFSGNFQMDVNTSGVINAADVLAVKARNGLTLAAAAAPTITNLGPFTTMVGGNYFSEFIDSQAPTNSLWGISAGTLPQWVTLNTVTGYLSGKSRASDVAGSPYNFSVSLTNTNGVAVPFAVSLIVTAAPPPTVTQVSPSTSPVPTTITITGTGFTGVTSVKISGVAATTFTVNSATQISAGVAGTTTTGNVIVTTSGGGASATSATSLFTVGVLPPGDYSIDNPPVLLPNPSRYPNNNPPLSHTGVLGLGANLFPANNAYHMDATVCNSTPAIVNRWQQNIDYAGDMINGYHYAQPQDLFAMGPNDAITYKFTVPNFDIVGGVTVEDNISSGANQAPAFMTVSKTPCDFDTSKVYYPGNLSFNACYSTNAGAGSMNWSTTSTSMGADYFVCKLNKGETYYVNLRFQYAKPPPDGNPTATSCVNPSTGKCGGMIRVQ